MIAAGKKIAKSDMTHLILPCLATKILVTIVIAKSGTTCIQYRQDVYNDIPLLQFAKSVAERPPFFLLYDNIIELEGATESHSLLCIGS